MTVPQKCVSVCFTGHRDLDGDEYTEAMRLLDAELRYLITERGARRFFAGGALGFDTCAAYTVLGLRLRYPHISLELMLPCGEQDKYFTAMQKLEYRKIIKDADRVLYASPYYTNGCMLVRDRMLVDAADLCVAFLRPGTSGGGTAYTVRYAERSGVPVLNLCGRTEAYTGEENEN